MSVSLLNSQTLQVIYNYFQNSYFDIAGISMPTAIALPVIELVMKIVLAIVALATSVNEFIIFMKNKKLADILKPAIA